MPGKSLTRFGGRGQSLTERSFSYPMEIYINGEAHQVSEDTTVARLLEQLHLTGRRIAVEINHEIIGRDRHTAHGLASGDRIEIVLAIGGG